MNIKIIIEYNPFFLSSASANRWQTLVIGLANQGVTIELLIFGGYQTERESEFQLNRKNISCCYIQKKHFEGYWQRRLYTYILKYFYNLVSVKKILNKIDDEDIIWTDTSAFSFSLVSKIKKKYPKVRLFTEMSEFMDIHKFNKGNFLQSLQADYRQNKFEKIAFYKFDGLALMTRTLMKHYQSFSQPHPHFLHLPMTVDLDRFNTKHEKRAEFKSPYIAFIGVMNDAKDGVDILIKAFNLIHKDFEDFNLYLVGPWNYDTPNHLQLIKDFGLENKVFWMKEYHRDTIPSIVCNAELLVLPRPDSKQAQGGFPTKLGEYLASGKPVCATTVGEIPDYLRDGESVFFAEPGSVDSFAEAMQRALSSSLAALQVGANGRMVAETHFNKDIQSKILYDFFHKLKSDEE
ncbi:MAG: glycosyltransferase [Saprospiraceae bacterium]|nr:glycosyltransferase [Saprospiraceae bacterium]